ncbi:MAG: hypothetical protein ACYC9J_13165 [Sulfuricaulis sp.]
MEFGDGIFNARKYFTTHLPWSIPEFLEFINAGVNIYALAISRKNGLPYVRYRTAGFCRAAIIKKHLD